MGINYVKYVDPAAGGAADGSSWANAYTTINAWEQAWDMNLTTNGDTMTCYFRSSGAHAADTTALTVLGWTTDATSWIKILHGQWEDPVDGSTEALGGSKYNEGQYRIETTNETAVLIYEDYVTLRGMQSKVLDSDGNNEHPYTVALINPTNNAIEISHCYAYGHANDTYYYKCFDCIDADTNLTFYNNTAWHRKPTPGANDTSMFLTPAAGSIAYNNTTYGGAIGLRTGGTDTVACINNIAQSTTTYDFLGDWEDSSDYNADEDDTGTGANCQTGTVTFVDAANGDFRLAVGDTVAKDNGSGATPKAIFTVDAAKTARPAVDLDWDIGSYEYVAGGPAFELSIPATMYYYKQCRK